VEFRALGNTSLRVSRVGLGTVKLGRNEGVKYPRAFPLPSDEQVRSLLEGALVMGVRLFDTAPAYGSSEQRLGAFVQAHRDELVLSTKCGESFSDGRSTFDYSAAALRASVEGSLKRLRTEMLDILLIHSNGDDVGILEHSEAVETLLRLKEEGKCRAVGISAKTVEGVEAAAKSLDVVMAPYSLADRSLERALAAAHEKGLGILVIKGLASGHLGAEGPDGVDRALQHVFSRDFVDSLVVGTLSLDHLAAAVDASHRSSPGE